MSQISPAPVPKRPYGSSGIELSILGFGGILVMNTEQEHATRLVAESVERGINYFDVAPSYGDAEVQLGPALEPYRNDVFLACKTGHRDRDGAEAEFKQSLERLRTDYFDLYQLHALNDVNDDVDAAFAGDGVMGMVIEAKKAGQIRHVGFSAHSVEAALVAMDRYDFDSILFPFNFAMYYEGNFGPTVLARAQEQGVARLALKAMARQKWPADAPMRSAYPKCWYEPLTVPEEMDLALRWTLSQPITAAIPPGEEPLWWMAVTIAARFTPLTAGDQAEVEKMAQGLDPLFQQA
jgi:aryl-alcohol dehydrogenase-like predicted oxidoreductase